MHLLLLYLKVQSTFSTSPDGRTALPTGIRDHIIVAISVLIVIAAAYLCIKYFIRPEEKEDSHIKHRILDDGAPVKRGKDT